MIQTKNQTEWKDDKGTSCPYTRVTKLERDKESAAAKIIKEGEALKERLSVFKEYIEKACKDFYQRVLKENNAEDKLRKGNFTWYNFDKSVRVEVNVNERIEFKSPEIDLAKEKLDSFIKSNLTGVDQFIQELVNDAFQNTKGNLDAKKVLSLLRHRTKIKKADFQEALDLIEKSIERTGSKTYYKISTRNEKGEYDNLDLNFSNL